jgi:hypothetical protein
MITLQFQQVKTNVPVKCLHLVELVHERCSDSLWVVVGKPRVGKGVIVLGTVGTYIILLQMTIVLRVLDGLDGQFVPLSVYEQ